jgi:hypothetical protein
MAIKKMGASGKDAFFGAIQLFLDLPKKWLVTVCAI